jgi:hypothetical protein
MSDALIKALFPQTIRATGHDVTRYFGNEDFIAECYRAWNRKNQEVLDAAKQTRATALLRGATAKQANAAESLAIKTGKMAGNFGSVYKLNVGGKNYFIKCVRLGPEKYKRNRGMILNELIIAMKLTVKVPEAVSNLEGAVFLENKTKEELELYLIYEGPDGYDLRTYITKIVSPEEMVRQNLYEKLYCSIKAAQNKVNEAGYVHRDIKPENIFVQLEPFQCKLIDLGLSVELGKRAGIAGTPEYMPKYMVDINAAGKVHLRENLYMAETGGITNARHNNYSVDMIWSHDFRQAGPPPDCADIFEEENNAAEAALVAAAPAEPAPAEPAPAERLLAATAAARPPLAPLARLRAAGPISPIAYGAPGAGVAYGAPGAGVGLPPLRLPPRRGGRYRTVKRRKNR